MSGYVLTSAELNDATTPVITAEIIDYQQHDPNEQRDTSKHVKKIIQKHQQQNNANNQQKQQCLLM